MKLYNTPTKKIEEVKPLIPEQVTVYTCGPTVYDYPHIGNWFTFIRYDTLVRVLRANNLHPKWVMNITDVGHLVSDADEGEDKLEKGAKREGKSAWDIAEFYSDYFIKALDRLNISQPFKLPRATDHIQEQIDFIKQLEAKGYTYVITDGIYYDTSKFPKYADFAHLKLADQEAGKRIGLNSEKKQPSDFALWKFSPKDHKRDMEWDSPWGKGFPGWHIECSAMSIQYLGETIDIHGGGIDHIPVHHTNEIAQSEAVTGKPFVNHWFHSNFILVNGKKMAKSEGNYFTLEDIEKRGIPLEAFRLLILESHYRSEAEFSWENLEAAFSRLKDLYAWADLRHQPSIDSMPQEFDNMWLDTLGAIKAALENDLNTPLALSHLSKLMTYMKEHPIPKVDVEHSDGALKFLDSVFGLKLDNRADITDEQKELIKQREQARNTKDFAKSDELRDHLEKNKIGVRDTDYGPIWYRL